MIEEAVAIPNVFADLPRNALCDAKIGSHLKYARPSKHESIFPENFMLQETADQDNRRGLRTEENQTLPDDKRDLKERAFSHSFVVVTEVPTSKARADFTYVGDNHWFQLLHALLTFLDVCLSRTFKNLIRWLALCRWVTSLLKMYAAQ